MPPPKIVIAETIKPADIYADDFRVEESKEFKEAAPEPQLEYEASPLKLNEIDQPEIPKKKAVVEVKDEKIRPQRASLLNKLDTNATTLLTLIAIILIGLAIVAGNTFIKNQMVDSPTNTPATTQLKQKLADAKLVTIVIDDKSQNSLAELIESEIEASAGQMIEIAVTSADGKEVGATLIFEKLPLGAPAILRQSLFSVRFISINKSRPSLLVNFSDKNTVLGSFLQWENSIATNFSDLYKLSADPTTNPTDKKIANSDTRIIMQSNNTVLLYGLLGDDQALISNSESDFESIAESIKKAEPSL